MSEQAEYGFVAYIDEGGDPGLRRVRPDDEGGSTEWLTMSAVVVAAANEAEVVGWVRNIRADINAKQGPELHFRNQGPRKSLRVCDMVAELPLRCFCVCSNKRNMKNYRNKNAENVPSQEWFYNWVVRLLMERVTEFCYHRSQKENVSPKVKVVLSQRGGLRYAQMRAYFYLLQQQARHSTTYLAKREIVPECLDWNLMKDETSRSDAGLQLADVVASAFFQAVNTIGPNKWETAYAERLKPRVWSKSSWADEGVLLTPFSRSERALLTEGQRSIFRYYGYAL